MQKAIIWTVPILACISVAAGQQRRRVGQSEDPSIPGVVHFTLTPVRVYDSLSDVYSDSSLVVQADVKSVLPPRDLSTVKNTHNIVTDVIMNVTQTFKGPIISQVDVVQHGETTVTARTFPTSIH